MLTIVDRGVTADGMEYVILSDGTRRYIGECGCCGDKYLSDELGALYGACPMHRDDYSGAYTHIGD